MLSNAVQLACRVCLLVTGDVFDTAFSLNWHGSCLQHRLVGILISRETLNSAPVNVLCCLSAE